MTPAAAAASAADDPKPTLRLAQDLATAPESAAAKNTTDCDPVAGPLAAAVAAESHLDVLQRELDRMRRYL